VFLCPLDNCAIACGCPPRRSKRMRHRLKLTQENIQQLEDAGFKWSVSTPRTFDERYAELMKYKEKVGHCNASERNLASISRLESGVIS